MNTQNIITAIEKYNAASRQVVSANIRRLLAPYNAVNISKQTGIATQTIYSWTKRDYGSKPTFEAAIKLCDVLGVGVEELTEGNAPEEIDDRPMCRTEGCGNRANAAKGYCWTCYRKYGNRQ